MAKQNISVVDAIHGDHGEFTVAESGRMVLGDKELAYYEDVETYVEEKTDSVPTEGSGNLISSGGVYDSIKESSNVTHTTTTRSINLTDVKVGDDLSGAVINFNPNNLPIVLASDAGLSGFQWILWTPYGGLNFGVIWNECFIQDANMNYLYHTQANGSDPTPLFTPNWIQDTYTFPEGAVVQSLYDLNGNRQSWQDFEDAMADTSWKPSMATVDLRVTAELMGDSGDVLIFQGSDIHPKYNDVDIALISDIPTDYVDTNTFNELYEEVTELQDISVEHIVGNTQYRENVDIPVTEGLSGDQQQIVTSDELGAHAEHDLQMFNELNAAILNNQFTPEQLQAIVNQAIESADGTLVTDDELSSALKSMKNYADSLQFRQVIQIAKEDIDWASRQHISLAKTSTDLTVTADSSYGSAKVETTWTADRDCYAYIKFNMYSPQAAYTSNGGGSQIRVFVGVNGLEVYSRVETLGNGAWAGWTGTCWRKVSKGDVVEFRSSKQQAIGYSMGSFFMDTFGVKSTDLDGLDQKADKYFVDVERDVNFGDLAQGMDLSGMTIELPPLDATNPQNISAVIPLNFTSGGRINFILSDDGTVSVSAFDSVNTGQTLYEDGTSPLTPVSGTYTFPGGSVVDTFDPAIFDVIGGDWKEQLVFPDLPKITEKDEVTIEELYNSIGEGTSDDSLPQLVFETLLPFESVGSASMIFGFSGNTVDIINAQCNKGITFLAPSYNSEEGITIYGAAITAEQISDGVRIVPIFTIQKGGVDVVLWSKNYSALDFGVESIIHTDGTTITGDGTEESPLAAHTSIPTLVQKFFSDTSVMYAWKGDTTSTIIAEGSLVAPSTGTYDASSDTTIYIFNVPTGVKFYLGDNSPENVFYSASDLSFPVNQVDLSDYATEEYVDNAVKNISLVIPEKSFADVLPGDDISGLPIDFTDYQFSSPPTDYKAIVFDDGGWLGYKANGMQWAFFNADGSVQLDIVDGGNVWGDGPWVVPDNKVVSSVDENITDWDLLTGAIIKDSDKLSTESYVSENYVSKTDLTVDITPTENSTNLVTSGGVYTSVENKVDKYSDLIPVTKTFADLVIGDDLSGVTVNFPDPIDLTNLLGISTNSQIINFTNGYYINLAANTVQTPSYFRLIDTNGQSVQMFYENSKTPTVSSYAFPDGFVISNIDRDDINQFYGGTWQTQVTFDMQVQSEITIKWIYDNLTQNIADLRSHVLHDADLYQAILVAAREEAQSIYDGTDIPLSSTGTTIIGTGGILDIGSTGQYTIPQNGGITITFSAVLALGDVSVLVNGNEVFNSSSISLLSVPPPTTIRVNTGDVVTSTGSLGLLSSLNVTFYPNKPI